jgi:hypothetical protein
MNRNQNSENTIFISKAILAGDLQFELDAVRGAIRDLEEQLDIKTLIILAEPLSSVSSGLRP